MPSAPSPPTARIAIGVGCRRGCSAAAIESLVRRALANDPAFNPIGIFTIRDKEGEPGLAEAARILGLALVFLDREALRRQAPFVQTESVRTQHLFGVPSVAEAAALAGAGTGAVLIVSRLSGQGVTCAIAGVPS